jgi:hypothetical protein
MALWRRTNLDGGISEPREMMKRKMQRTVRRAS